MPEDVAFISRKSGVETSLDGKVMSVTKKVRTDRQTDGFSSLYSRMLSSTYYDKNCASIIGLGLPVFVNTNGYPIALNINNDWKYSQNIFGIHKIIT